MRENRLYGSEGGGADLRSPYPYPVVGGTLGVFEPSHRPKVGKYE